MPEPICLQNDWGFSGPETAFRHGLKSKGFSLRFLLQLSDSNTRAASSGAPTACQRRKTNADKSHGGQLVLTGPSAEEGKL